MSLEVLEGGLFKRELTPKDKSDIVLGLGGETGGKETTGET